jgi:hypothetical protein
MDPIDPRRDYSLKEATTYIPSRRGGTVSRRTLSEWCRTGLVRGRFIQIGTMGYWVISGAELIRILKRDEEPEFKGRTPAERKRATEEALKRLRKMGMDV